VGDHIKDCTEGALREFVIDANSLLELLQRSRSSVNKIAINVGQQHRKELRLGRCRVHYIRGRPDHQQTKKATSSVNMESIGSSATKHPIFPD
jgi:hypothetical protein